MGCQPSLFSQDRAGGGASSSMNGKPSSSRPPPPRSEPRRTEPPRSGGKPAEERARLNNNVDSKSSSKGVEERARMAEEYKRLQDKCKEMEERIRWVGHRLVSSPRLCHYEKREKKTQIFFTKYWSCLSTCWNFSQISVGGTIPDSLISVSCWVQVQFGFSLLNVLEKENFKI